MKIKLFRTAHLIVFLVAAGLYAKAQTSETQYFAPQPFPRSPTTTAFEKYGTYQVNEYTGIPDISIQLYTIEAGGLQVPVSLSYHASGIKVTDVASWAGAGWSVSAGGSITRRVMGLADDLPTGYLAGFMWQPSAIDPTTLTGVTYLENTATSLWDSKPDIYSYDFPGHGGKFFFDGSPGGNFAPRLLPFAPLNIKYSFINAYPYAGITKFNVTDEHGNKYTFGDAWMETTVSTSGGRQSPAITSSWMLENMISQNRRDTVSFTYNTDTVWYPASNSESYTVTDQVFNGPGAGTPYTAGYSTVPLTLENTSVVTEKVPAQINFKNGKVVFNLDTAVRADLAVTGSTAYGLSNIQVYQYNYGAKLMELQKTIVFYKSYFNATYPNYAPRLRLDSIEVQDKAGSVVQHYRFDYNNPQTQNMPVYTSNQQDYWGYYNGQANTMLTPQQSVTYLPCAGCTQTYVTIGQANRNSDSTHMQACILTGIHYPTGGYSTFTYQTNQYDTSGVAALAGGLRVSSISSYDGVNPVPIVKTYVYNSARKNYLLDFAFFGTGQTHRFYQQLAMTNTCIVRTFLSNPHVDLEPYDAATVVYPSVTEYIGTPGNNVGRTDYFFTDAEDLAEEASLAGNIIFQSAFYQRGHLATKNEYIRLSNGTYQLVKATNNHYSAFAPKEYDYVGLAVNKMFYNDGPGNPIPPGAGYVDDDSHSYNFVPYHITSDDNYLIYSTTNIYDTNNPALYTTSSVTYTYNDTTHQQIAATTHTDSKGNTHVTSNKYAYDYLPPGGTTTGNMVLDSMINRHMYGDVVEKTDSLVNVATSVNAITGAQLNQYEYGSVTVTGNTVVPYKISTLSVAQPLTNFVHSSVVSGNLTGDSRYVQMISFDQYDPQNNILQYTPRNTTPVSILWDYLRDLPVAQAKNATTSYNSATQIAYTSFEADGKGNWVYSGTPVTDLTAPTGTLVYPLSAGNITSPTLPSGSAYVLSCWGKGGAATVTPSGGSPLTGTALNTVGTWTYYEYQIPTGTSTVTISGTTSIDELRLYPAAAQMTTYAYDPSGLRSISDTKGANSYFEYDYFQRLKNIKDWNGNIVKNYSYHTYDQVYGNQVQTGTFTRTGCPINTAPGSLTYTVPANRYYSSTQASANADAIYDMNTNGQIKANTTCACVLP